MPLAIDTGPVTAETPRNTRAVALVADAIEAAQGDRDHAALDLITAAALATQAQRIPLEDLFSFMVLVRTQASAATARRRIADMMTPPCAPAQPATGRLAARG